MNSTTHTAWTIDQHRAAQLDRENELIRRHSERPTEGAAVRPSRRTVIAGWFRLAALRPAH